MEREVGGGIGMGNTCKSVADSFQCMTKPTTIKTNKQTNKIFQLSGQNSFYCAMRLILNFKFLWPFKSFNFSTTARMNIVCAYVPVVEHMESKTGCLPPNAQGINNRHPFLSSPLLPDLLISYPFTSL